MLGLNKISLYINSMDRRETYKLMAIVLGITCVAAALIIYSSYSKVKTLQQRFLYINRQREDARAILEKNSYVLQQQARVDAILEKDKNFKIKEYFSSVVQALNLTSFMVNDGEISSEELFTGYSEIKLDVRFHGLDMRQLVELLYKIEQNERVYTKEMKIVKDAAVPKLDVSFVIATFETTTAA